MAMYRVSGFPKQPDGETWMIPAPNRDEAKAVAVAKLNVRGVDFDAKKIKVEQTSAE
jgi:hypothetical protein